MGFCVNYSILMLINLYVYAHKKNTQKNTVRKFANKEKTH